MLRRALPLVLAPLLLCQAADNKITKLDASNFFQTAAPDDKVWLLHFTSTKCEQFKDSPCQLFEPDWKLLVGSLKRLKIARVDIDEEQGRILAQRLGVLNEGIPNLKILKTKEPPADALMTPELIKFKKLRKLIGGHMKGHEKNADGMFLKVSRKQADVKHELDMHFYDALGVKADAKTSEIRRAYRKLSLEYHPDKHPANQERFDLITEASETLMNSDLRMLYEAYGREYKNPQFNQYRQTRMKGQHAKLTLFKDAEGVRNWLSKDGDELEKGLKKHLVLLAYYPWQVRSIEAALEWTKVPGLLGDLADVGAINCESETLCAEFKMGDLPSIQVWAHKASSIDVYEPALGEAFDADRLVHWMKANLIGRSLIVPLTKDNFEQKVINSQDAWVVVLCSYWQKFPACQKTEKSFNRLAYILKPLGVKIGTVFCPEEKQPDGIYLDEWCEVSMGVDRIGETGPWNFPFVKVYKRGGDKLGGEQINLNIRPPTHAGDRLVPDQVLEIIEKVMIMAAPEASDAEPPEVDFDDEPDEDDEKEL